MIVDLLESLEEFRAQWPFAARYARVNGWRMHYVDEGGGDPILLLHGNPTWGFPLPQRHPAAGRCGTPRHRPRHDRFRPVREACPRAGAQSRRAYRQPHRPGPPARSAPSDSGVPRLGRPNRPGLRDEQPGTNSVAGPHEHLGVADAAGGVPHPPVPVAHHARAPDRALSDGPTQCPGAAAGCICRSSTANIPAGGAGRLRGRPARCRDASSDLGLAAMDTAG